MRDQENIFDEDLALTSSQVSTNIIDLGPLHANNTKRQIGGGGQAGLYLVLEVGTAFTSSGSSTFVAALTTDDATGFGSATTLFSTPSIAKAAMTAGARFAYPLPLAAYEDYARLSYTVGTADFTGGTISAMLMSGPPGDWYAYADARPTGGY